jgi:hypothetical protein
MKVSGFAHLEPTPPEATSGSLDHGKSSRYRGAGFGVVYTTAPIPTPVTGADNPPKPSTALLKASYYVHHGRLACLLVNPALSNFEFLRFDGYNPRMWITNCETHFGVYDTDPNMWVRLATMHLTGSATLWFQTMQTTINAINWDTFVQAVSNKFDRDEHNHLLCHFFHIKQLSSIIEYVEQFNDIVHQLLTHDPSFPPTVITNKFIDGLKKEIRAVIMIHRPQDLDTASSLALL